MRTRARMRARMRNHLWMKEKEAGRFCSSGGAHTYHLGDGWIFIFYCSVEAKVMY